MKMIGFRLRRRILGQAARRVASPRAGSALITSLGVPLALSLSFAWPLPAHGQEEAESPRSSTLPPSSNEQPRPPEGPGAVPPSVRQSHQSGRPMPHFGVAVREWNGTVNGPAEPLSPKPAISHGLEVALVVPGSPAEEAGLQSGDILTLFEDQILVVPKQLEHLVKRSEIGTRIPLTFLRDDELGTTEVILDAAPDTPPTHPSAVLTDELKVTRRVVRVMAGTTTIALSTRKDRAYLEVSDAEEIQFSGTVETESEIPPETWKRIQRVASLENGQWVFKLPLHPPVELEPDDGPRRPAPVPD